MKISTRLALAGLTFALPVAMLFWFMDLSFRHDLGIGRTELAGTAFMRKAFEVMRLVPEHRVLHLRADAGDTAASAELPEASARVFVAIKDLQQAHEPFVEALRNAPGNLALKPDQAHPHTGIQSHWRRVDQGGQGYAMLLEDLAALMREAEDRSLVALDPVLDSHALGSATVGSIPGFLVRVSSIETLAASHAAGGRVMHSRGDDRDMLVSRLSLLKADLEAIMRFSATALDEDSRFYTTVASMERDFRPALDDFRQATDELTAILERLRDKDVQARDLMDAAHKARLAGHVLLDTGLDALDDMIRARVASYRNWQLAGAAVSGAAMLLSVLIGTAAIRRVTRSVHNVAEFARRVGDGDYNAQVECGKIPELFGMAQAIQRMVGQLKEQIGSLYGVLQGMTVPCLAVDTKERLTFINQPYLDLYESGGKPADYLGMTVGELFYGDKDAETHTGRCLREGRRLRNIGIESVTPSGRRVSVRYDVAPVHDLDGVLIGAFALIIDMTEIKDQQREIERLAAFPEVSPIPTLSVNADGSVAYANRAAERAMQNLGLLDRRNFLPDNHEEITAACLASGQNSELEYGPGESTFLWNYHPLPDQGRVHVYASDITARKRAERQILHDAFHDALTGLPNKALFMDRLEQAALRARRDASRDFAVLLLDMDDFKHVNDSLGHAMGDKLLMEVAARLGGHLRDSDTLARLGGDEFGIIMEPLSGPEQAMSMAGRIADILADPFSVEHNDLWASAAVGIVFGGNGRRTADELLRDADTAMFRAKAKGKGEHSLFDDAMHKAATDRLEMETALKRAVDNGEFVPFYQPLVDLATGRITGFEALVRWHRPGHGLVPPGRFIPLAEETGLVVPIGAFMLEKACRQAVAWQGLQGFADLTMSVNMAVRQMVRPGIVDEVSAILEATGVAPSRVKIEVTESGIMENMDAAVQVLQGLKDLGVRLAIDDFGTGYSSLAHLHRFPFGYLKVDQSFVSAMETAAENREIIETIVGLGHSLGKTIIAEGVETDTELAALRAMGCGIGQGYLFARPLPAEDAEAMLRENPVW